jgi:glucan biosynthesis protein C
MSPNPPEAAMKSSAETPGRLYYLDWIRVLAMFGIFFFHNARFYDALSDWHVKNATTNLAASISVGFISQWIMPLFFLVAGASTFYALKSRRPAQYAQERTLRLLIPLIFGMLIIVVPQAYFEAVSHGEQLGGYNLLQIYWLYLQTLPEINTFHLWYLLDLFLFSIITIPLFLTRSSSGKSVITRLAAVLDKPWALVPLLIVSITAINVFLYPDGYWGQRGSGGWNIVTYLLFFILGYLIFANARIMQTVRKLRWINLGIGLIAPASMFVFFFNELTYPAQYFGSPSFVIASLVQSFCSWGWLLAILGFGSLYLNWSNRFLSYANEAVLPFYVLHQTIIITIGYYVVQWDNGVGLKYLTVSTASFIGIMLLYELLVRRLNVLRFLFGMRLRRRPRPVLVAERQT